MEESECGKSSRYCPEVYTAINGILFIAEHKKRMEESTKVTENKQKLKGDADKLLQQTLRFLLMNILWKLQFFSSFFIVSPHSMYCIQNNLH